VSVIQSNPNAEGGSQKVSKSSYLQVQLLFLFQFLIMGLVLFTLSRLFLITLHSERVNDAEALFNIMLGGVRIDLTTLLQIISLPFLGLMFLSLSRFKGNFWHQFIRVWCWIFLVLIVLMEAATPTFIAEYDARPNRLFFEYLSTPSEVAGMLIKGYWFQVLLALLVVVVFARLSWRWMRSQQSIDARFNLKGFLILVLLTPVLVFGIRSGLQHRPINPAMVAFSHDSMLNTLPLNSTYSVIYALYQMKNEASASKLYGALDDDKMISLIKANMPQKAVFISDDLPTLHTLKPTQTYNGKNLIIVVEESLGAQFVGSLGGKNLTPNIDAWSHKSWFFNQLYATGTRSARGLEAISTGFLPSPARAVLKLPKAQKNFYTLAQTLQEAGYESSFIYGGESHFDNMKGFFLGNGFVKSIDQNNYENPQFIGNWGVSDEDLFDYALAYLKAPSEQPKFSLIFTSSNHTPYEFPDKKIELFDEEKQTVNNAVKYADFALGGFLQQLEQNGFMENSVIMVVADHDARVMGETLVPIERFHIPGFIISADIQPKQDNTLVSQIDLSPTLLSLLGIDLPHPMIGQDLSQLPSDYQGRVMMQYANNQAFVYSDRAVVLQANKKPVLYGVKGMQLDSKLINPKNGQLMRDTALAHAQFASWAYDLQKYTLGLRSLNNSLGAANGTE